MSRIPKAKLDYSRPIALSEDVYWVGFNDPKRGLHCNPYLIVDGDEAVLLDGGSRPEFSTVMMKIMQTGVLPGTISTLIYHHYDPDLCGSIPHLEKIIDRPDLKLVSQAENNIFIRYYSVRSRMYCIEAMERRLTLKSGRTLRFIPTPYAHSPGSFMTYDEKSGILFSSDIMGSHSVADKWDLYFNLSPECENCTEPGPGDGPHPCSRTGHPCPFIGIDRFHRVIMTSNKALQLAAHRILELSPAMVAPQHGSVIRGEKEIRLLAQHLYNLKGVGIDGLPEAVYHGNF